MNVLKSTVLSIALGLVSVAWADVPYTKETLEQAQKNGDKVLLHFHADWCPTCKAQKKVLKTLEDGGLLSGVTVITVDFDKETELKKQLGVQAQSTFVAYYGGVETARVGGETNTDKIKGFIGKNLVSLTLADQLRMMNEAGKSRLPPEKAKAMADATAKLRESQIESKALKVGKTMPNFVLTEARGQKVNLKDLLKKGPVVVSFYRGGWCPYCNAQLNDFRKNYSKIKAKGATLVAITPEKPDLTTLTEEQKKIEFPIVTDESNKFAKKIGIVFGVTGELKEIYKGFGIDLEKSQGNADWNLPVPATYVVSKSGKVTYAYVNADYTQRASADDVLKHLD